MTKRELRQLRGAIGLMLISIAAAPMFYYAVRGFCRVVVALNK